MNILIVASKFPPEYSGPGVRIPKLYNAISQNIGAKQIRVLCGSTEYTESAQYEYNGLKVERVTPPATIRKNRFPFNLIPEKLFDLFFKSVESVVALKALNKYDGIDLFHILGNSGVTSAALYYAKKNNIPVFQELVTAKAFPCQRFLAFGKACPPQESIIVTMREDAQKRCRSAGYGAQIWHRPNPFNEDVFYPLSADEKYKLRRELSPFTENDIVISTVAKIMPQKNQIFLLDVLHLLDDRYKLIIAGPKVTQGPLLERDQAYLHAIHGKIREYNLTNRVHLHTDYVESHLYMKASDIYALPAYDEGFGTPMMESIACGVPVVANAGEASFAEWISHSQNGYLVPLNAAEWAESCRQAAQMPSEKKLDEARKIVNLAGQTHIYNQYIEKIRNLTAR